MSDKKKTAINQTGILRSLQKIEERSKEENKLSKEPIHATTSKEENPIFDSVNDVNGMKKMTNFESCDVQEIYGALEVHPTKGRHSSISLLDSLVLTLYVLKNATSFSLVSHSFYGNLTHESMIRSAVNRVVPLLLKSLKAKWWEVRLRPIALEGTVCPNAGLIIDSSSFEINIPSGKFSGIMAFFDGKNEEYALKKEVAVMAHHPHFALFSSESYTGSTHDMKLHGEIFKEYEKYLLKQDDEGSDHKFWDVLADKGYVGETVPSKFRRLTPSKKPALTKEEKQYNMGIHQARVHVERFFGRLKKLWKITHEPFRYDNSFFDNYVDLCILLTNEDIQRNELVEDDKTFYENIQVGKVISETTKKEKKQESTKKYREKRIRKLEQIQNGKEVGEELEKEEEIVGKKIKILEEEKKIFEDEVKNFEEKKRKFEEECMERVKELDKREKELEVEREKLKERN